MKTRATGIISFCFIFSLISVPRVFASTTPVPTVKTTVVVSKETPSGTTITDIVEQKVEYTLPYPGILPTHPLYRLKLLRDWVMERLIVDPLRKTEFYVLQADKYLAMALVFAARNTPTEGARAARAGEAFMVKGYAAAQGVKNSGKEIPGHILDLLARSTAKHIELLSTMRDEAPETAKSDFSEALAQVKSVQGQLGNLR